MDGSNPTDILSLPLEVLKRVLDFLPIMDKKNSRYVCNKLRFTLDEFGWPKSVAFRPKVEGSSREVASQGFLQSYRAMEQVKVESCDLRMSMLPHKERELFPAIQEVILGRLNSQATVANFLKFGCKLANSLVLEHCSPGKTRRYVISGILKRSQVGLDNLTKLTMKLAYYAYVPGGQSHHYKSCSTFLKHAKIPNLCEFAFTLYPGRGSEGSVLLYKRAMANFAAFLANHAISSRNLAYRIIHALDTTGFDWSLIPQSFTLESCTVDADLRCGTLQELVLPKLITGCGVKKLKFKCWTGRLDDYESHDNILKQILAANASLLEELELHVMQFELNWIRPCKLLKSVRLVAVVTERAVVVESEVNPEEYHFPRLTNVFINLKSQWSWPRAPIITTKYYEKLLSTNATTIKNLTIDGDIDILHDIPHSGWRWLNDCINIEYLCLCEADFSTNIGAVFPCVKKFDIGRWSRYQDPCDLSTAYWIAQSLPNVKIVTSTTALSLLALQVLLAMEGLNVIKFIHYPEFPDYSPVVLVDIQSYCNSEAMKNSIRLTMADLTTRPGNYTYTGTHCNITRALR